MGIIDIIPHFRRDMTRPAVPTTRQLAVRSDRLPDAASSQAARGSVFHGFVVATASSRRDPNT
jgi:hypothetical protein